MFNFFKKRKEEPEAQEKRDAMQRKSEAADALIRSLTSDRRSHERRHDMIPVDWERRQHA